MSEQAPTSPASKSKLNPLDSAGSKTEETCRVDLDDDSVFVSDKIPPPEILQLYQNYIDYVRHENDLLNHRTTWFVAIESLLIAGAGYLLLEYFESAIALVQGEPDEKLPHIIEFLLAGSVLNIFGLTVGLAARRSIRAAIASQCKLDDEWRALSVNLDPQSVLPDMMGGKCTPPKDGQHFADRLVFLVLIFWTACAAALLALGVMMPGW